MAVREVDHLLIGGGIAAANCARTLREEGAEGSILVVGRELDPPYERPPLSKGYLQAKEDRASMLFRPDDWWEEQGIELLTRTSVMKLDPRERLATLSSKEDVRYGSALLATGANVRRLRAEGGDLDGIHYLRALGNADAIRADAQQASRVVLIGGSYIGCEVAASLAAAFGCESAIVMQEAVTLERQFGHEIGGFFQGVLEEHGIAVNGSDELDRFEGDSGRVGRVVTKGGLELECDCVVIGCGVMPDVMLARAAGLELGESGGVKCSSRLETSAPGIYAAGDMCEYESVLHGRRARVEHLDVALTQGRTAALNMLGRDVPHETVPYFYADLADWASMEYGGSASASAAPVVRGSLEDGEFTAFYLDGGSVAAALTVGRSGDLDEARRLISGRRAVDAAALADEGADLAAF